MRGRRVEFVGIESQAGCIRRLHNPFPCAVAVYRL
jgi:hypothetical protein